MSAIASWARRYWLELGWGLFCLANLAVLVRLVDFETVPFHFVWVSLTLVYGYRVWRLRSTLLTLGAVCVATGVTLGWVVTQGPQGPDELTEVPLMGAMFLAMVWHAQRRQAALEQVRQAAEREHEFVRDASHQLKTPITVARGFAQLLREEDVPVTARNDLDVLLDELDRLAKIAEGLLVLAATQGETLVLDAVDVDDIVEGAGRRWRASARRRWHFECHAHGVVRADRLRLDSALDALIENAVQATDVEDRITLVAHARGETVVFDVSDSGVGIPDQFLPRVFDRFWTTSGIERDDRRGTGLGLAIVKAIAKAHGGSVSVQSVVGVGTSFRLQIPEFAADEKANGARPRLMRFPSTAPASRPDRVARLHS